MDNLYRKKLDELAVRYEFHPDIRDLYVEGPRDVAFYNHVLQSSGGTGFSVYEINSVEITRLHVLELGLNPQGNRGRVIALSCSMDQDLAFSSKNLYCAIDNDLDFFALSAVWNRFLVRTAFSGLEAFVFSEENINKTIALFFGQQIPSVYTTLFEVLRTLFFLRLVKRNLCNSTPWLADFRRQLSLIDNNINIDLNACCLELANASSGKVLASDLLHKVNRYTALAYKEPRHAIHGHDLINTLGWLGARIGAQKELCVPSTIERHWISLVNALEVAERQPFKRILSWLKAGS